MSEYLDDGHGPKYGCNYRYCGNPDDASNCPFTADEPQPQRVPVSDLPTPTCQHNWMQLWVTSPEPHPDGFYCTKCLSYHD